MPFVVLQLVLFTASMLAGGSLITWILQARRHKREQQELEQSMIRALEARYHVYEDLEQGLRRVLSRFERIEKRMGAEAGTQAQVQVQRAGERRAEAPEVWDAEREFEVQRAELAEELARQGRRIAELMARAEGVEQLEQGLQESGARCVELEQVLAAERIEREELEGARAQHIAGLTRRVHELEAQNERLGRTERELDDMQRRSVESERRRKAEVDQLQQRLAELEGVEVELAELRRTAGERAEQLETLRLETAVAAEQHAAEIQGRRYELEASAGRIEELEQRIQELERSSADQIERVGIESEQHRQALDELRASREALQRDLAERETALARRDELVQAREADLKTSLAELAEAQEELRRRDETLQQREIEVRELTDACRSAEEQVASHRSRLKLHAHSFEAAQSMLAELRPMLEALESRLNDDPARDLEEVESALPKRKGRGAPAQPAAEAVAKTEPAPSFESELGFLDLGD